MYRQEKLDTQHESKIIENEMNHSVLLWLVFEKSQVIQIHIYGNLEKESMNSNDLFLHMILLFYFYIFN